MVYRFKIQFFKNNKVVYSEPFTSRLKKPLEDMYEVTRLFKKVLKVKKYKLYSNFIDWKLAR